MYFKIKTPPLQNKFFSSVEELIEFLNIASNSKKHETIFYREFGGTEHSERIFIKQTDDGLLFTDGDKPFDFQSLTNKAKGKYFA